VLPGRTIVPLPATGSRSLPPVASHAIGCADPGPGGYSPGFGACGKDTQARPLPVQEVRGMGLPMFRAPSCGSASVLAWPYQVERPVGRPRSRFDAADLAGDPRIDAGAAGDREGIPGRGLGSGHPGRADHPLGPAAAPARATPTWPGTRCGRRSPPSPHHHLGPRQRNGLPVLVAHPRDPPGREHGRRPGWDVARFIGPTSGRAAGRCNTGNPGSSQPGRRRTKSLTR
jgi:hypothetical protein